MKDTFLTEISTLMNDGLKNKVALYNENASKYTDQAVREAFFELLGDDKLTYQNYRNHKILNFPMRQEDLLLEHFP